MLPPDPRNFKDLYVVFELLESDLHTVIGANDDLTQDHHKVRGCGHGVARLGSAAPQMCLCAI